MHIFGSLCYEAGFWIVCAQFKMVFLGVHLFDHSHWHFCKNSTEVKVLTVKVGLEIFWISGKEWVPKNLSRRCAIFLNFHQLRKKNMEELVGGVKFDFSCTRYFIYSPASFLALTDPPTASTSVSLFLHLSLTLWTFQNYPLDPSANSESFPPTPFNKLSCRTLTSEQTKISVRVIFNHKKNLKKLSLHPSPEKKSLTP